MSLRTTTRAVLTRLVTVGRDGVVSVVETDLEFRLELTAPRAAAGADSPPRSLEPYTMRWRSGPWGLPEPVPGGSSRIWVSETAYELLGPPRTLAYGPRAAAYEARALPVTELYPFDGVLTEQDGTDVEDISLALWSPSESHSSTGDYEDFQAEASVDFIDSVRRNRQVHIDDVVYRIMTASAQLGPPRVVFSVRRAGG